MQMSTHKPDVHYATCHSRARIMRGAHPGGYLVLRNSGCDLQYFVLAARTPPHCTVIATWIFFSVLTDPAFWPENVCCRRYYTKPRRPRRQPEGAKPDNAAAPTVSSNNHG